MGTTKALPPVKNAGRYLSADLHSRCLTTLAALDRWGYGERRISFRRGPPTPSERWLAKALRDACRRELGDHLPIRLYFSARTTRAGRPRLTFRKDALRLVGRGHRLEYVAAYYGCHAATLRNWGARQPPKRRSRMILDKERRQMLLWGLDHVADLHELPDTIEAVAAFWRVSAQDAQERLAGVGKIIHDIHNGALDRRSPPDHEGGA